MTCVGIDIVTTGNGLSFNTVLMVAHVTLMNTMNIKYTVQHSSYIRDMYLCLCVCVCVL